MYLADTSQGSWALIAEEVRIEARGARGAFRFTRLSADAYAFRMSLAEGHTLGEAAGRALEVEPAFDPGMALRTLLDERLITSIGRPATGGRS